MPVEISELVVQANAPPAISRVIEVEGSALAPDIDEQLERAVVIDRLAMPDTFELVFRDPGNRDILERAGLKIGKKVKISTTSRGGDAPVALISGEVTGVEADYDGLGARAVVRGYDLSHRLNAGRRTQIFTNVTYSDIARQLARDAGLQSEIDDSHETFDHVIQANQSDWEFLVGLSRLIAFECRVEGDVLSFKKPTPSSSAPSKGDFSSDDPRQLVWGARLLEFRARISAMSQVKDVKVRGWDVAGKKAVVGRADVSAPNANLPMKPAYLASKVGGKTLTVVDRPVDGQGAADALARARAEQVGGAAYEATAVAEGSPILKAGVAVNVSGVDTALAGEWVISTSRHEFGDGAYRTHLEFSGHQDRSLHGLVANGTGSPTGSRIAGVVIALVAANNDPDELGRVKLRFPWLSDNAVSNWARVAAPGAGAGYGVVWIPQVDDEVLVAFEHGDVSHPVVLGGLWNGQDPIPFSKDNLDAGLVTWCGFVSRTGHQLNFWESADDSSIQLLTKGGAMNVVLDEMNGELRIEIDGKLVVDATGDIEFTTKGAFKVKASGDVTIKGTKIALNPPGA
jgi:phage protein D/phage baseplate assembly protein gpV